MRARRPNSSHRGCDVRGSLVPDALTRRVVRVHADVVLAARDHLVGDLHEQGRESLGRVVVAGNVVHEADGADETRDGVDDELGIVLVEDGGRLLEGVQVPATGNI